MREPSSMFEHPVLGRGFRPFFLLAALYSIASMLCWIAFHAGTAPVPGNRYFMDPVLWHAHEMLFGFVMAVIAGFLLTAVANWTGGAPVRQIHLMLLGCIWIAGRIAMNLHGLPLLAAGIADCAFIPALAISLSIPLIRTRSRRNFVFLGLLTALFACNVTFFVTQSRLPLHIALLLVITMISIVGGRIIPAFTVAGLRWKGLDVRQTDQPWMDRLSFLSMPLLMLCFVFAGPLSPVTGLLAFVAAAFHAMRLRYYHVVKALREPMLWILHAGYAWLVVGLVMLGFVGFCIGQLTLALHALTAGCIGSMCIGMMCRVTLGHTGRNIMARPHTVAAFVLMQAAAVTRVLGPAALPMHYMTWIEMSGMFWMACYAVYVVAYAPMLVKARPDGLPA